MANGNLDYSTIYGGLTGGGQNLSSMVNSLVQTLQQGGYYGSDYSSGGTLQGQSLDDMGAGMYSLFANEFGGYGGTQDFNFENLISALGNQYGDEGTYTGSLSTDVQGGMGHLYELLKQLSSSGIATEYGQESSDVGAEVMSQQNLLSKTLTGKGKGARYSSIQTGGGRRGPGGRKQYLRDYYGLQQKKGEMMTDLQEDLTGGYEDEILRYMQFNPSST